MSSVGLILDECQRSSTGRKGRTAKSLAKLRSSKPDEVDAELLGAVRRCLVASKREPAVERVITGIVSFAVSKGQQTFLDSLLQHLLHYSTAKDKNIRQKCCQMLRQALASMADDAEMSDDLWQQLLDGLLARSKDKNPGVRAEATASLDRLQTGEEDCPAMQRLLDVMQADASADVRKAATGTVQVTRGTLEPLLRRARDEAEAVRAVAVGVLGSKAAPGALDQTDRTRLLLDTLSDPAPAVRSAGRALALRWFAAAGYSLPALAALAGDVTDPESERAASFAVAACMEAAARGSPPAEAKAARVGSAGAAPIRSVWKQAKASIKTYKPPTIGSGGPASGAGADGAGTDEDLAPTAAIVWRVRCDWLAGRGAKAEGELEACLPNLSTLALAIKKVVDAAGVPGGAGSAAGGAAEEDLGDFAEEMMPDLAFVLRQLLALCAHADWGDEAGRSRVEQVLVGSVLARPGVPDSALFGVTGALLLAMGGNHDLHARRVIDVATRLHAQAGAELAAAGGMGAPEEVAENCALAVLRSLRIVSALLGGTQADVGGLSAVVGEAMQGLVCPAVASPYPAVRGAAVRCLAADAVLRLGASRWSADWTGSAVAWADGGEEAEGSAGGPSLDASQQAALEAAATALEVSCRGIAREEDECRLEAARGALDIVCALPFTVAGGGPAEGLAGRCAAAGRRAVLALMASAQEHIARPAYLRVRRAGQDGAWRVRLRASVAEGLSRAVLSGRLSPLDGAPHGQDRASLDARAIRTLLRLYCSDDSIGAEATADASSERAAAAFETIEDEDEAAEVAAEGARDAELCLAADARMRQVVGSSLPTVAEMGPRCRAIVARGASEALRALMDGSRRDAASLAAAEALGGADPSGLSAKRATRIEVAARAADPGDREVALSETAMSLVAFLASGGEPGAAAPAAAEPSTAEGATPTIAGGAGTPAETVAAALLVEALADPRGPFAVQIARSLAKLEATTVPAVATVAGPLAVLAQEALEGCERAAQASLTKLRDSALAAAAPAGGGAGGGAARGRGKGRSRKPGAADASSACEELEADEAVAAAVASMRGMVADRREEIGRLAGTAAGVVLGTMAEDEAREEGEAEAGATVPDLGASGLDASSWEIEGVDDEEEGEEGEGGSPSGGGRRSMMSLSPEGLDALAEEAAGGGGGARGSRGGSGRRTTIRGSVEGSDLRSAMEAAVEEVMEERGEEEEEEGGGKGGRSGRGRRGRGRMALQSADVEQNAAGAGTRGRRTRRRRGVVPDAGDD